MDVERLDLLRREVREVTEEIIRLMGKRFSLIKEINDIKIRAGIPVRDLAVEEALRRRVAALCDRYKVKRELGLRILNLLIEESVRMQEKARGREKRKDPI